MTTQAPSPPHEAEWACASASTRFFHCLDRRDYSGLVALMTDGGVWVRGGTRLSGGPAILDALRDRPAGLTTRHLLSNLVVDLEAEGLARVSYELSVFMRDGESPARLSVMMTGEDRLEHDGRAWRIQLKQARPLFQFDKP